MKQPEREKSNNIKTPTSCCRRPPSATSPVFPLLQRGGPSPVCGLQLQSPELWDANRVRQANLISPSNPSVAPKTLRPYSYHMGHVSFCHVLLGRARVSQSMSQDEANRLCCLSGHQKKPRLTTVKCGVFAFSPLGGKLQFGCTRTAPVRLRLAAVTCSEENC